MSGFMWFLASIASFGFVVVATILPKKLFGPKAGEQPAEEAPTLYMSEVYSIEQRDALFSHLDAAKGTTELEPMRSSFSPAYFEELCRNARLQKKLGLESTVKFVPAPLKEDEERQVGAPYYNGEGYMEVFENLTGCYTETITDIYSGKAIKNCRYPKAEVMARFCRIPNPPNVPCPDCGGTLATLPEHYFCEQCHKFFDATGYSWVLCGFGLSDDDLPINTEQGGKQTISSFLQNKVVPAVLAFLMFGAPILSFFVNKSPIIEVYVKVSLLVVIGLGIITGISTAVIELRNKKVAKTQGIPKAASIATFVELMTKQLFYLRDTAPADVRPYMSDAAYAQWCSEYVHEGDYLLDCYPSVESYSVTKAEQVGDFDFVKLEFVVKTKYLDKNRSYHASNRDVYMWIYRKRAAGVQSFTATQCKCGTVSIVTQHTACPNCGAPFNYELCAWKLDYMNYSTIFEWGEKIYGTY